MTSPLTFHFDFAGLASAMLETATQHPAAIAAVLFIGFALVLGSFIKLVNSPAFAFSALFLIGAVIFFLTADSGGLSQYGL
jgi:hypothetical protein